MGSELVRESVPLAVSRLCRERRVTLNIDGNLAVVMLDSGRPCFAWIPACFYWGAYSWGKCIELRIERVHKLNILGLFREGIEALIRSKPCSTLIKSLVDGSYAGYSDFCTSRGQNRPLAGLVFSK